MPDTKIPTVAVENADLPEGFMRINDSEFNAEKHVRFYTPEEKAAEAERAARDAENAAKAAETAASKKK